MSPPTVGVQRARPFMRAPFPFLRNALFLYAVCAGGRHAYVDDTALPDAASARALALFR